jgi:serine-protein kinase ATM
MEQVFEQVSKLLQNHTATRQRSLHIRTYKVLPLSATSGIMEFVQNTIPLNDYVMPAHERYNPKEWKWNRCRSSVSNVATDSVETRVKEFRKVMENFSPILRHFFFERFKDPEDWFQKRLAYTRSTAAISILGHVLGLGDRHCHNILLDEKSGEVVHIDLGVAFEAGRVLPIPEVVPFRLTRDIVDAMGVNKTEGVFRRCCEFTMEALREERESIMTLLNVLRYDPLYSWSVSPLRAKRMQESEFGERGAQMEHKDNEGQPVGSKRKEDEVGEASRALSVVEKKLSKTLSTAASVNELIQQATDERNLALLYCGWSAWA